MSDLDLKKSVRQLILKELPYDRKNQALCAELKAKDTRDLLITYHNWINRHIQPRPRTPRLSNAYKSNPIVQQRRADLEKIVDVIRMGGDLKPHLSRRIKTGYEATSKPLGERSDLDLMLNDWNVHHLHISQDLDKDGFVKRGGPLLFAVFQPDTAYLIDVMDHNSWTREHCIRVIADEWPNEGLVHEIKKVTGLSRKHTEKPRSKRTGS